MSALADASPAPDGVRPGSPSAAAVWDVAATVNDPEIPVLTIADLGILRAADLAADGTAVVMITPTYSGCPAMGTITADIRSALRTAGYPRAEVRTSLSPAWTTDWMTPEGRQKLRDYGIAPPSGASAHSSGPVPVGLSVKCPRCSSLQTRELARFGSTSCKALYQCRSCLEPFDYFKVL